MQQGRNLDIRRGFPSRQSLVNRRKYYRHAACKRAAANALVRGCPAAATQSHGGGHAAAISISNHRHSASERRVRSIGATRVGRLLRQTARGQPWHPREVLAVRYTAQYVATFVPSPMKRRGGRATNRSTNDSRQKGYRWRMQPGGRCRALGTRPMPCRRREPWAA